MKVIVLSLDTLRADHLSCYGYPRPTSPHIDVMANEGIVFHQAIAGDIPTQPAHTSLFTGQRSLSHGIVAHDWPRSQLKSDAPWLPALLAGAGFTTAAVDNLVDMKDWFARAYDYYLKPRGLQLTTAESVNALAFPWLEAHRDEDFYLFLHYWDAHTPYVPPRRFAPEPEGTTTACGDDLRALQESPTYLFFKQWHYDVLGRVPNLEYVTGLYDAEIAYLDHHLGKLVQHLRRLNIYDDTLLVLLADHGENMAEHDAYWDHAGLYDSNVRIPLIMRYPARISPRRVDGMVQPVDVFPTICDLLDLPIPAGVDGRSLLPHLLGSRDAQYYDAVFLSECTWQAKRGVRTAKWKFIRSYHPGVYGRQESEPYDLEQDPGETNNLASVYPETAGALEYRLLSWVEAMLGNNPDPMKSVIRTELPGVRWMDALLREHHHTTWAEFLQSRR